MKEINICLITQKYDENDPYRSNVVEWIRQISLNPKVNSVHIITRYKSRNFHNEKCSISNIQSRFKIVSLMKFYFEIIKVIPKNPKIFIHMGGPYAINLFIFKIILGLKVYQWWAHPVIGLSTRIGFYLTINKLFTCTENSFPINSNKKCVIGHGVNISRFPLRKQLKPFKKSLVTASRLTYRKNIHKMINLVDYMNNIYAEEIKLTIYGSPLNRKDVLYQKYLINLINESKLNHVIEILPAVDHKDLHSVYEDHNIYLNFSETALDKAVLEAMSTGIPVLSCNECLYEIFSDKNMLDLMYFDRKLDINLLAEKVNKLINLENEDLMKIIVKSHNLIKKNHSIEKLTNIIVNNMFEDN